MNDELIATIIMALLNLGFGGYHLGRAAKYCAESKYIRFGFSAVVFILNIGSMFYVLYTYGGN